jgi:hypothetical protein
MRVLSILALLCMPLTVSAVTLDFEDLSDSTPVTDQYVSLGVSFEHASILTAGYTLLEWEFPPHSGSTVLFDDGGPLIMRFTEPVAQVTAYITYAVPVTFTFYDRAQLEAGSLTSAFGCNMALSGDPGASPNELFTFTWQEGISTLVITGDSTGTSFTLDDLTITAVPEVPSLIPLSAGLVLILLTYRLKRKMLLPSRRSAL